MKASTAIAVVAAATVMFMVAVWSGALLQTYEMTFGAEAYELTFTVECSPTRDFDGKVRSVSLGGSAEMREVKLGVERLSWNMFRIEESADDWLEQEAGSTIAWRCEVSVYTWKEIILSQEWVWADGKSRSLTIHLRKTGEVAEADEILVSVSMGATYSYLDGGITRHHTSNFADQWRFEK